MDEELLIVGKRMRPPDAVEKATGSAKYAADIKLPEMLIGRVLRCPYPHAKILRINKSKAKILPGVKAVISLEDVPKTLYTCSFRDLPMAASGALEKPDQHILADKGRYWGDAVAAVAAVDEKTAEEALGLIEIEYEELHFVIDPEEAMKPGAPKVHDYAQNNIVTHMDYPFTSSEIEKSFSECDCIVEGIFSCSKQLHCILEPQTCIARFDHNGRVTIWTPNQLAHLARRELAHIFNMPAGMIRVINPFVGGSFGSRLSIYGEPICIALAMKTGKPVKLEYSMEENFTTLETRVPLKYSIKMGFKKDGTLHARQIRITTHGAYKGRGQLAAAISLMVGLSHYRCPNRAGDMYAVYTNTQMSGALRGFGSTEIIWGLEQLMDEAADKLGIDPIVLRLKNIKNPGELGVSCPITSSTLDKCIIEGAEKIGWKEKRGRKKEGKLRRGIGMATAMHCSGSYPSLMDHSSAFIKFNEDGSANLIVHPGSPGTNSWGTLSQIAAEELGINVENIHIVTGDTDITMFDIGSHASRTIYVTGNAVLMAAREAKGQLLNRATKVLGVLTGELEIKKGQIFIKSNPSRRISVTDLVKSAIYDLKGECLNISGRCSWEPKTNPYTFGASFADVEVDTETCEVRILKLIAIVDCGKAINPMTVEGQCEGAIQQGIGQCLTEDYVMNKVNGKLESTNFSTYKMPGTLDMPEVEVIIIDNQEPTGPFGAKGVGELPIISVAPAIANAIFDAIGIRIMDQPVTPEKIFMALKAKNKLLD